MFVKLDPNDEVLHRHPFTESEVPYNLIHLISGNENSFCLKSSNGDLILAQTPGLNAWVWATKENDSQLQELIHELIEHVKDIELPGLSGEPKFIEKLASAYSLARSVSYRVEMLMESYSCSRVLPTSIVNGILEKASDEHVETIAQFFAGFAFDAYGTVVEPSSQLEAAERTVRTGNLYFLFIDSIPVSMANIAHRSARHARINAVYTPSEHRNRGFASAVVAKVCDIIYKEGLTPMLYTDLKNSASNKVYKNIGFVERGKIADIKFSK